MFTRNIIGGGYRGVNGNSGLWPSVDQLRIPCPKCTKPDWCQVSPDGKLCRCNREKNAQGGNLHVVADLVAGKALDLPALPPPVQRDYRHPDDVLRMVERFRRGAGPALQQLSDDLGVSVSALTALQVGWWGDHRGGKDQPVSPCWTFPERNAAGTVVGLIRRFPAGDKKQLSRTKRGLTLPPLWRSLAGPVVIVEGASDVAAGLDIGGLVPVGRPGREGGIPDLLALLADWPTDRDVIVCGENDRLDKAGNVRPNGDWPGREGAIETARQLALGLRRPVSAVLPPEGIKDLRQWWNDSRHTLTADRLLTDLQVVERFTPPADHSQPLPGEIRSLQWWSAQLTEKKLASLTAPGVYLDSSPVGSGKSWSDRQAVPLVGKAVIVVPTVEGAEETATALRDAGIDARATPKRVEGVNCWNPMAGKAEKMGLSILGTACLTCPHGKGGDGRCWEPGGYQRDLSDSRDGQTVVLTHARVQAERLDRQGADLVIVHESALDTVRPYRPLTLSHVRNAARLLQGPSKPSLNPDEPGKGDRLEDSDRWALWRLRDVTEAILTALESPGRPAERIELPPLDQTPEAALEMLRGVSMRLFQATIHGQVKTDWGTLLLAAAGGVEVYRQEMEFTEAGGTDREPSALVIGLNLPSPRTVVWFHDATALRDQRGEMVLEKILRSADLPVTDSTPSGILPHVQVVRQVIRDVHRRTSPDRVVDLVAGVLARSDLQRVGVICHSPKTGQSTAVGDWASERTILSRRVGMVSFFGSGLDRNSNRWISETDGGVVAGTPRRSGNDVRRVLLQSGDLTNAALPTPGWISAPWIGRGTDGNPVEVHRKNYAHPVWADLADQLVRGSITQAGGRWRTIRPEGKPVTILTNVPLPGVTVETDLPASLVDLPEGPRVIWETLQRVISDRGEKNDNLPLLCPSVRGGCHFQTADLAGVGVSRQAVQKSLTALSDRGLVERVGGGVGRGGVIWRTVQPEGGGGQKPSAGDGSYRNSPAHISLTSSDSFFPPETVPTVTAQGEGGGGEIPRGEALANRDSAGEETWQNAEVTVSRSPALPPPVSTVSRVQPALPPPARLCWWETLPPAVQPWSDPAGGQWVTIWEQSTPPPPSPDNVDLASLF